MEIDDTQKEAVLTCCRSSAQYAFFTVLNDLAGKVRYLKATKKREG
jgi:hypothetical protein